MMKSAPQGLCLIFTIATLVFNLPALAVDDSQLLDLQQQIERYNETTLDTAKKVKAVREEVKSQVKSVSSQLQKQVDQLEDVLNAPKDLKKKVQWFNALLGKAVEAHATNANSYWLDVDYQLLKESEQEELFVTPVVFFDYILSYCYAWDPNAGGDGKGDVIKEHSALGSSAAVFNPSTGVVEWNSSVLGGIAGAYNPQTGEVEWEENVIGAIAAVYNPRERVVHFEVNHIFGVGVAYDQIADEIVKVEDLGPAVAIYDPINEAVVARSSVIEGSYSAYIRGVPQTHSTCSFIEEDDDEDMFEEDE